MITSSSSIANNARWQAHQACLNLSQLTQKTGGHVVETTKRVIILPVLGSIVGYESLGVLILPIDCEK